jgi:geranylgeranyl diphosphate synthase, type II
MNHSPLFSSIKEEFERFLHTHLPRASSFHPHYEHALSTMLTGGGKRLRPCLLLGVVDAYDPLLIPASMHIAFAVECLHTYSLIHDDLPCMDDASMRRNTPTLHISYDESTAVLAGDALNTFSFFLIAQAPLADSVCIACIKELSHHGGHSGMVLGQALDCHFHNQELKLSELQDIHLRKTARLIAASLKMGGIITGIEMSLQHQLYQFGLDLGLAFQIQDDIIDTTQSQDEAGKNTQCDSGKNSYVNLLGLKGAITERDHLINKLTEDTHQFSKSCQENLLHIIHQSFTQERKP